MILKMYNKAFSVFLRRPVRLWGVTLLGGFLSCIGAFAFGVIPLAAVAVSVLFDTALAMICLRGLRGTDPETVEVFDCFRDWATIKRVLCGTGWMMLWIFLWSLIPVAGIVFGIIRTYEYRLTPYILMQEPEVRPTDAIKVSRERTRGWKGKMFWADALVFAAFLVVFLILLVFCQVQVVGVLFMLLLLLFTVAYILLAPLFLGLVKAAFYEEISAERAAAEAEALPETLPQHEETALPEAEAPAEQPGEETEDDPSDLQ